MRLSITQLSCIALDLGQDTTEVGCFLSGHATVLVEIERFVSHRERSHRFASDRSTDPIDINSIARPVSAGTSIIVATRRNAANENPSIISSSVMTWQDPAGNTRSTPLIRNGCLKLTVSRRERVVMIASRSRCRSGAPTACAPFAGIATHSCLDGAIAREMIIPLVALALAIVQGWA
jgi:hypothetical protein